MEIVFNDIREEIEDRALKSLLIRKALFEKTGIAVAVNQQVVPRSAWAEFELSEHDEVLVITATAGG